MEATANAALKKLETRAKLESQQAQVDLHHAQQMLEGLHQHAVQKLQGAHKVYLVAKKDAQESKAALQRAEQALEELNDTAENLKFALNVQSKTCAALRARNSTLVQCVLPYDSCSAIRAETSSWLQVSS